MDSCSSCPGKIIAFVISSAILGGSFVYGKMIETRQIDQLIVTVSGEGKVMANPDIAEMNFGVQTGRLKTAAEAMDSLGKQMAAVIETVKAQGVEEKDIATQYLNLNPSYDWNEGERIDRGFEANQNVTVKVRDINNISKILSAAASAGANQVGNVSFTIDNPEELKAQAREKAIKNGQEKASALAAQLGRRLGKLKGFSEGGGVVPYPMYEKAMAYGMGGGADSVIAPPVPSGEQEVRIDVSLTYELR